MWFWISWSIVVLIGVRNELRTNVDFYQNTFPHLRMIIYFLLYHTNVMGYINRFMLNHLYILQLHDHTVMHLFFQ